MNRIAFILLITSLLFSCTAIPLNNTDADKLRIQVDYLQLHEETRLDTRLKHGVWDQPVVIEEEIYEVVTPTGEAFSLRADLNKKGRYGVRLSPAQDLDTLFLESYPEVRLPYLAPVLIDGMSELEGGLYTKQDRINIWMEPSQGDERYLVATATCGGVPYTTERILASDETSLTLSLNNVLQQINNVAEADLQGMIPITIAIEERYYPAFPGPFIAGTIAARDEAKLTLDNGGISIRARVRVRVSPNVVLGVSNQRWPSKFCNS